MLACKCPVLMLWIFLGHPSQEDSDIVLTLPRSHLAGSPGTRTRACRHAHTREETSVPRSLCHSRGAGDRWTAQAPSARPRGPRQTPDSCHLQILGNYFTEPFPSPVKTEAPVPPANTTGAFEGRDDVTRVEEQTVNQRWLPSFTTNDVS